MVRTKLVEHFYPFPRPDGNPCIQELELEMFEGKKYFFYNYVFVMGRDIGILKFVQAKTVIGLITAEKMM